MANPEDTEPNLAQKVKDATAKVDPWADRLLDAAKQSAWTPWIIVAVVLGSVMLGAWLAR